MSRLQAGIGVIVTLVLAWLVVAGTVSEDETRGTSRATAESPASTERAARQLVVAPNGNNTAKGDEATPWRTLRHAFTSLRPGDTLTVRGGTYDEQLTELEVSAATEERPIRVLVASGEKATLRGLLWLRDASHWHVKGLNVTWARRSASHQHMVKFNGGKGWSFTEAEVWGARSYAAILVTGEARDWLLGELFVHATRLTHGPNQDHLIYISSSVGGVVERSLLTDSPNGRAVKIGPPNARPDPIRGVVVRYNTMYSNLGPSNIQLSGHATDSRIYRNIMVRSGEDEPNVTAYRLGGTGNVVYDNIAFDSAAAVSNDAPGLIDMGGNLDRDPEFVDAESGNFRAEDPVAREYGRYADWPSSRG